MVYTVDAGGDLLIYANHENFRRRWRRRWWRQAWRRKYWVQALFASLIGRAEGARIRRAACPLRPNLSNLATPSRMDCPLTDSSAAA